MKLPSKVTAYKDSTIALFPIALAYMEKQDMTPQQLYSKMKSKVTDVREFFEIVECLYALNKLELKGEVLHYVS